ncbi:MAG: Gfo/Idh/MocA family oxidoreductase [Armatimonadota bacterium]
MRVGIIGCGQQGRVHASAYARIEGVQIVGCCDVLPERAQELAQPFGAKAFTDYREMLAQARPEVVSVCTLEGHHAQHTIDSLQAGAHVLCEKMLAAHLDEARRMIETAEATGKLLATQFNYRHIPSIRWLKELLVQGMLGTPLLVTLTTSGYCHHHGVDLLRFLFGEIVAVQAHLQGGRDEAPYHGWETGISEELLYIPARAMGAIVQFASGLTGVLASSARYRLPDLMLELQLLTDKGRLTLRRMRSDNICGELDTTIDLANAQPFPAPVPFAATFPPSIRAFVDAIRGEGSDIATAYDGLRAMEIEHALMRAHQTGRQVDLG